MKTDTETSKDDFIGDLIRIEAERSRTEDQSNYNHAGLFRNRAHRAGLVLLREDTHPFMNPNGPPYKSATVLDYTNGTRAVIEPSGFIQCSVPAKGTHMAGRDMNPLILFLLIG